MDLNFGAQYCFGICSTLKPGVVLVPTRERLTGCPQHRGPADGTVAKQGELRSLFCPIADPVSRLTLRRGVVGMPPDVHACPPGVRGVAKSRFSPPGGRKLLCLCYSLIRQEENGAHCQARENTEEGGGGRIENRQTPYPWQQAEQSVLRSADH